MANCQVQAVSGAANLGHDVKAPCAHYTAYLFFERALRVLGLVAQLQGKGGEPVCLAFRVVEVPMELPYTIARAVTMKVSGCHGRHHLDFATGSCDGYVKSPLAPLP